jgi:hypothetical protein
MGQHVMCVVGFVQAGRADEPLKQLIWWHHLRKEFSRIGYQQDLLRDFMLVVLAIGALGLVGYLEAEVDLDLFSRRLLHLFSRRIVSFGASYFVVISFRWFVRCVNAVAQESPLSNISSVFGDGLVLWIVFRMADVAVLVLLIGFVLELSFTALRPREAQPLAEATATPENPVRAAGRNGARRGRSPAHTRAPNPVPAGEPSDDMVESNARDALAGMSEDEVRSWLVKLGHAESALVLRTSHTAGDVLEDLTDSDLEKMGIASVVERKRLLALFNAASTIGPGAVATSRVERARQRRGGRHRQSPHR